MGKYKGKYRPQFHFSPPSNWMNDPNGLFYNNGEYHLFYQHNPFENIFGHLSWGHAVSKDLVHWEHLPVALTEEDGIMVFSGSIVVDYNNISGFGNGTVPPVIAVYTGHQIEDGRQSMCLAYSNDTGLNWIKYENNPVLDNHSTEFRDPKVFFYEPHKVWIMIVATGLENRLMFFSSANLVEWKHISNFSCPEYKKIKWECPDLFRMHVDNDPGNVKWVLLLSKLSDHIATDTSSTYFVGDFNGKEFIIDEGFKQVLESEKEQKLDCGRDFYAAVTWGNIPDVPGITTIAWMNNWKYAERLPTKGWNGAMTIPRQLILRSNESSYKMIQGPVKTLESQRVRHYSYKETNPVELNSSLRSLPIEEIKYEIVIETKCEAGSAFSLELYNDNCVELIVEYDDKNKLVTIERDNGQNIVPDEQFYEAQKTEFDTGGVLNLRIYLDRSSVEIFVNDGELVMSSLFFTSYDENFMRISSNANDQVINLFEMWELESIWKNKTKIDTINSLETDLI